ncbi:MAG: hypothetical protein HC883_02220 [Bdellovibrionaceae bacterium]|nr:hypothetical protein [Pseudobdellovibrionaceae bacterium]
MNALSNSWGQNFSFTHDNANRLVGITRPGSNSQFAYTDSGGLLSIHHRSGGNLRSFVEYEFDLRNYPIAKRQPAGVTNYAYDLNGQIISSSGQSNESFSYDEVGNRLSDINGAYSYDPTAQRLTEDWEYFYLYDANGNLAAKNPKDSSKLAYTYSYSSKNQLTEIKVISGGALGSVSKEIRLDYDVMGRRMQKVVTDLGTAQTKIRRYVYNGENILAEYDGNNALLVRYQHSPLKQDDILSAQFTSEGVAAGLSYSTGDVYYLKDALGSVTDILSGSGELIQTFDYSAYGTIKSVMSSDGSDITASPLIKTSFAFTGREFDEESKLYYYRSRYYDSSTGRFLQQDADPGKMLTPSTVVNRYTYAGNSPANRIDPRGLSWFSDFLKGSGGYATDLIVAAALVGVLYLTGGYAMPAVEAVGAVVIGSFISAGLIAAFQEGSFFKNTERSFHSIFRVSAIFLAGTAIFAPGGVAGVGSNGYMQGSVMSKNPWFGSESGLTIGPAATFSSGDMAFHELSHTLQFFLLSANAGYQSQFSDIDPIEHLFATYGIVGATGSILRVFRLPEAYNPIEFVP